MTLKTLLQGCVLWLEFREPNGSTVYDLSTQNNHGTIYGAQRTGQAYGRSLKFDGIDDYVKIPYANSLYPWKNNNPCTFEAYIKPDFNIPPPQPKTILQNMDDVGVGRTIMYVYTNGQWTSYFGGSFLYSGVMAVKGAWTHLTLRYDGSTLKWYINGKPANEDVRGIDEGKIGNLLIGTHKALINRWKGNIAFIRVYNRALTPKEIQTRYQYPKWAPKLVVV